MSQTDTPDKSLDDYDFVFEALKNAGISPVLVGGLSVSFWQEEYRPEIQREAVIHSKDLDLLVKDRDEALDVERATGFAFEWAKCGEASPCLAVCQDPDHPTDLLWTILGPKKEDVLVAAMNTSYRGWPIRVINPVHLLEAKLANCQLDQTDRMDVVQLCAVCEFYPIFIRKTFESIRKEGATEREQITILKIVSQFLENRDRAFYLKTLGELHIPVAALFEASGLKRPDTPRFNRFVDDTFIPSLIKAEVKQGMTGIGFSLERSSSQKLD